MHLCARSGVLAFLHPRRTIGALRMSCFWEQCCVLRASMQPLIMIKGKLIMIVGVSALFITLG
jgi:hypothetical protein